MDDFIQKFKEATGIDVSGIQATSKLAEIPGFDSLARISIIVMFDLEYKKKIMAQDLNRASTIGELYMLTQNKT